MGYTDPTTGVWIYEPGDPDAPMHDVLNQQGRTIGARLSEYAAGIADDPTVEAAAVAAMQDAAVQARVSWMRGTLTTSSGLHAMRTAADAGGWRVPDAAVATALGLPEAEPGVVFVHYIAGGDLAYAVQEYLSRRAKRYSRTAAPGSTAWSKWTRDGFVKGTLTDANLADIVEPGTYRINATSLATVTGLPPTTVASPVGHLTVTNSDETGANWPSHRYEVSGSTPEVWYRMATAGTPPTWPAWTRTFPAPGGDGSTPQLVRGVGTPNELRMQAFREAYPLQSTGGKGVVVFRYDHGLTYIKQTLLALHQQHGIPFYVAMNSRRWDITENAGATPADVKAWMASGVCQVGNHSATHDDASDRAGIYDSIVNGRRELEEQLSTTVHGFTIPGTAGTGLGGLHAGSIRQLTETYAGEVALAAHAITSGTVSGPHRKLDGIVRQGFDAYSWERETWTNIKAQIDAAITNRTALTLMAHPRVMGYPDGYFTAALAAQVLAYVAERIAAGQLAPMTYYQSLHATTAPLSTDTGWRDITSTLSVPRLDGIVLARRVGNAVTLKLEFLKVDPSGGTFLATLAAGFRPDRIYTGTMAKYWSSEQARGFRVATSGVLQVAGLTATDNLTVEATFYTKDAWPATLPGVAA